MWNVERPTFHHGRIQGLEEPGFPAAVGFLQHVAHTFLAMAGLGVEDFPGRRLNGKGWIPDTSTSNEPKLPQRKPAAEGAPVARPAPRGWRPRWRRRSRRWGVGSRRFLGSGWSFPREPTGAGVSQSSWTEGPAFAFRREARGPRAEVTESQAPCRGPGGDAARTRHRLLSVLFTFSHRPQPPAGLKAAQGTAWGSLCALSVCWAFSFRRALPPPLSSGRSCAFPRSQKGAETSL